MAPFPFYKHSFTSGNESMLLYVHVPFCEHKCTYCNFAVDVRPHEQRRRIAKLYVDMLSNHYLEKLDHVLHPEVRVPGIDIGGGTPTLLEDNLLEKLMKAIKVFYDKRKAPHISASWRTPGFIDGEIMSEGEEEDWSISIESTPFIAANFPNKLKILRENGVGRISIGLQSTSQGLLDVQLISLSITF
jgi:oxygen-independent coproporphyrinogen-3 oxidase